MTKGPAQGQGRGGSGLGCQLTVWIVLNASESAEHGLKGLAQTSGGTRVPRGGGRGF